MQHIEIQTTQNVTIDYELASLQDRFVAMLIDGVIVLAFCIGIIFLASSIIGQLFETDNSFLMIISFVPIITFMGYHLVSEIVANGQSWGKKIMHLKVVRLDGEEVGLSDYLLRAIFHIVDTLFSGGIIAAIMIASSQRKQRLGDMTANTVVIRLKPSLQKGLNDILTIVQNHEPIYLAAKHFNEADMLLAKSMVERYKKYPNAAHRAALDLMVERFSQLLELAEIPQNKIEFLNTLVLDYVVMTR